MYSQSPEKRRDRKHKKWVKKLALIQYKGGECYLCGWRGHPAAFEFHHVVSEHKSFTIATHMERKYEDLVKEVDKCIMICSNCHRIEHSSYCELTSSALLEQPDIKAVVRAVPTLKFSNPYAPAARTKRGAKP